MNETVVYSYLLVLSFLLAGIIFTSLFFISAPYGRHIQRGWGPMIKNRLGWLVMETPAALGFAWLFFTGSAPKNLPLFVFLGMWEAHYLHRAFIYPFRITDGRKRMPLIVMTMAFIFNMGNAYLNGKYLFSFSGGYPLNWLLDPRFIIGGLMFIAGYSINRQSDQILRKLRTAGEIGYKIPYGGFYKYVSCPNYLGEIIEWSGWAIATWSLPGLLFALWTIANLAPRARTHHKWYENNFPDYPPERKGLIPRIW